MKWINKGNEKLPYNNLMDNITCNTTFYIYGVGKLGKELYILLKKFNMFEGFIDNNKKIQEIGYKGEKVISEEQYWISGKRNPIIIAASKKNTEEIKNHLQERKQKYNEDYFIYKEFIDRIFPIIAYELFNISYVNVTQICVTERCTLKCKKCAHACYAVPSDKEDLSLEQVKKSADIFFSKIDYIQEFVLIGGEPLLYKYLYEAIEYIGTRYRNKMSIFSITTNGTIKPSISLLNVCKKYNVLFRISNYSNAVKIMEKKYEDLKKLLDDNEVSYMLGEKETTWVDYGFEYFKRNNKEEELIEVFDKCHTACHEIRENRFYYCVMARSVSENLSKNVGESDYLDFNKLQGNNWKRELLEYLEGYSEKGYLDMCRFCHGADCYNYIIPAALQ